MMDKEEREYEERLRREELEHLAQLSGPSKTLADRLTAVKNTLLAKGYECPSVEIGLKVMKNYGPVFWATIHLSSPKNWCSSYTHRHLDEALEALDQAASQIPPFSDQQAAKTAAMAKLSPKELALLGVDSRFL